MLIVIIIGLLVGCVALVAAGWFFCSKQQKSASVEPVLSSSPTSPEFVSEVHRADCVPAAEDAMREGVLQSAVVLLLMTHGIFRKERDWVTRVELLSAIAAKKAIIGVNPGACAS